MTPGDRGRISCGFAHVGLAPQHCQEEVTLLSLSRCSISAAGPAETWDCHGNPVGRVTPCVALLRAVERERVESCQDCESPMESGHVSSSQL